jgi:hypothetical protein
MRPRLLAFGRFLLGVMVAVVANLVAGAASRSFSSALRSDLLYRPLLALLLIFGFLLVLKGMDHVEDAPLEALKLSLSGGWLRELLAGLLLGVLLVALAAIALAAAGLHMQAHLTAHAVAATVAVVFVLATGALAEELMFRGYPFQRLVEAIGPVAAVVFLSALFGATHLLNPHVSRWAVMDTAFVGVLLSLAYLRTRRLWLPWGLHFAWNATLGLVFGLPVSGLTEFAVVVRAQTAGPQWLTGGSYGIEASVTGAAAVLVGIVVLLLITRGWVAYRPVPQPALAALSLTDDALADEDDRQPFR